MYEVFCEIARALAWVVYDSVFLLVLFAYLPFYFHRNKITFSALKEKLGFFDCPGQAESVWIQVVSVGEVNMISNFIQRLRKDYDYRIVITTTTLTGNKVAKEKYSHYAQVMFFPFDVSWILKKIVAKINPAMFVAVETEIWPNLFRYLYKQEVPIVIINGRISDQAFDRYRYIKPLTKKILNLCDGIGVQNSLYEERFLYLGAPAQKLVISGNMKFEGVSFDEEKMKQFRNTYEPMIKKSGNLLFVCGCTHEPEEELIVDVYKQIYKIYPELKLIIAPRHPERVPEVERILSSRGFLPRRLMSQERLFDKENDIGVIDGVGQLVYFYNMADFCFVGGSFSDDGGHNILEPIFFLKPVIFGPHMENFPDIEKLVLKEEAGLKVYSSRELKDKIISLIKDETLRKNLSDKCLKVFNEERKDLENNFKIINNLLSRARKNA
ncbi:MAG: glycosyltransferase N-terminal domain-containing protein [Candidatus Omnitrophica bacterium]|nr:glycosyltransferase N-terminal domain-containing protein [Candidatus Omnitrophota bacterium]MDD5429119.1 glycosyltransferase N-terminal domain-containing protein [Candidatus Omnitrophota bacterium]